MSWWQFWKKDPGHAASVLHQPDAALDARRPLERVSERSRPVTTHPTTERRLTELRRRRQDARFDVEQGELAAEEVNPWSERIALLTDALATIEADRQALDALPVAPVHPLPTTLIEEIVARGDFLIEVSFRIGGEPFSYREETDWNERGGPTVRGDLRRQSGSPEALLPPDAPPVRRDALLAHLDSSLDVFATDLRDRFLTGMSLPERPTLADLAQPCPRCGGWQDWQGRCPECARRDLRRQELRAEWERLERARAAEAEERHRLVERLPVARRRLALIESELAAVVG
jgi:hypothetical protein